MTAPRVLHFVSGGFSGATQVAIDLVRAARQSGRSEPMLVLRRKRHTDAQRLAQLAREGLPFETVPGWAHVATVTRLVQLCRRFRPQVLVAHGFPEHLDGRMAGLLAGVPALVHVEHNSRERYTPWRMALARWLARRTGRVVGCSEGVKARLLELGFPADRTIAIPNGIRLEPFADADDRPWRERSPGIVMSARFARQKDHRTLIEAVALLAARGLRPPVQLAGAGNARYRRAAEALAAGRGLGEQIRFLGFCTQMPELLMSQRIFVLSTHYEGMPLALVEGMAAGCAVVGSDVVGVRELIDDGRNGRLVAAGDAQALADALESLLRTPDTAAALARAARSDALARHSLALMTQRYEDLIAELAQPHSATSRTPA
jgi:glycosyltransferase involved in cell wall biosynthesis